MWYHVLCRRNARISAAHTVCPVFLDADKLFYEQWKGDCKSSRDAVLARILFTRLEFRKNRRGLFFCCLIPQATGGSAGEEMRWYTKPCSPYECVALLVWLLVWLVWTAGQALLRTHLSSV